MNINTSVMFYCNFVGGHYVRFNLWGGIVAASSLVGSLVSSLVGSSSSGCRYSFTTMVLKSVGLLGSYILYISLLIPSSLNRLVHLPLCPVLPLRHMSISKLRGRLWIMVIDRPFC